MNTEKKPSRFAFSPKTVIVILLALCVVVFSGLFVFRTVLGGAVLDSIPYGSFRFDLCGDKALSQIKVYQNGEKTATVKTSSVGNAEDHYGVTVTDLNFDGYPDLLIACDVKGTDIRCNAWIWNHATGTFRSSEALTGVLNPTLNEEYGCIISHKTERRDAGEDSNSSYYEEAEVYTVYCAYEGNTVEFARYEFVYYTKNDIYAYLVSRFDEKEGTLSAFSEDTWLSPDEAVGFSLSEKMTADMAQHRDEYPNAASAK